MTSPLKLVTAPPAPATRVCRKCGDERPAAEFPGFHRQCAACRRAAQKEWRDDNVEYNAAKQKEWRIANVRRNLLNLARQRAARKGLAFDLLESDIVIPVFCPVLGIRLRVCAGRMHPANATIDRLENARGYVRGNIAVISWRANCLKRDASASELESVAAWMRATCPTEK